MAVNRSLVLCRSAGPSPPGAHGNLGKWVCPSPALPALSVLSHPLAMPFILPPELLDTSLESPAEPQTTTSTAGLVFGVLFPHIPLKCDPSSTVTCSSCVCEMVEIRGKRAGSEVSPAGGHAAFLGRAVSFCPHSCTHDAPDEGQILPSQLHPSFLRTWSSLRPSVLKVDIPAQELCA